MKLALIPGDKVAVVGVSKFTGEVGTITQKNDSHAVVRFNQGNERCLPLLSLKRTTKLQGISLSN